MSYIAPNLPSHKHCFFSSKGGVSTGKYASLNFSLRSQDNQENILKNLDIAASYYNKTKENLNILIQGVSNKAVYISEPNRFEITADGAVTDKLGIILGIRTADCAPVLFFDETNKIIGAAHAGWRGALTGIMENTLNLMISLGADKTKIAAAIGPCLQKQSFECQQDMLQKFLETDETYLRFFSRTDATHWLFDAEQFCVHRLQTYGLNNISASGIDTYTETEYFSYRRNCHQNLISVPYDYPTHLSTITL